MRNAVPFRELGRRTTLRAARLTLGRTAVVSDPERNGRAIEMRAPIVASPGKKGDSLGIASSGTAIAMERRGPGPRTGRRHDRAASTHSKPVRTDQQ
ncbi:hypothetical protein Mpe_A0949 [Methylibium petroleiphilum PM1]|uniref:Uncharacterized protein n=1 Tax=Methylibium petroleiphilum (strain ATCC BAA-1232 / LMG 22953 / PM1) TaxID=420662 RepID=A2SEC2_METPP|nr:hypothetical protein Mpe_A0949 [Methylibium petroleiphilum PM1]